MLIIESLAGKTDERTADALWIIVNWRKVEVYHDGEKVPA